ncbi:hypothetical protein BMETH_2087_0 [methanotrophic bacterial endosymbiont of Bathymodiolus sp.]|nr:hypothetical protein BMETH_2087_0 [methanotrophic bacterial endosymbiont of Bathymodiolus sp.]
MQINRPVSHVLYAIANITTDITSLHQHCYQPIVSVKVQMGIIQ